MTNGGVHQEAPVASKKGSILGPRCLYQLPVFGIAIVNDINSKEAKVSDELSQVSIGDKFSDIAYLQSIFRERSNWF
jgi:hypothetical protein